jgi:hypothetical protein
VTVVQAASGAIAEAPDAHQAFPIEDSWYEEASQHPANLRAFGAYPVIAVCKGCHGRIRRRAGTRVGARPTGGWLGAARGDAGPCRFSWKLSREPVLTWAACVVLSELSAGFSRRSVLYRLGGLTVTCGAVSWILAKNSVRPGVVASNFSGRRLVNSTVAMSTVTPRVRETFEQRMDCTSPRGAAPPRRACRQRSSTGVSSTR